MRRGPVVPQALGNGGWIEGDRDTVDRFHGAPMNTPNGREESTLYGRKRMLNRPRALLIPR